MSEFGQQLIDATKKVAAENPDFVYDNQQNNGCVYVRDGKPSCLIGHALWNLKVIGPEFEGDDDNESGIGALGNLGINLDDDEELWLTEAQNRQDIGEAWAEAIESADAELAMAYGDEE